MLLISIALPLFSILLLIFLPASSHHPSLKPFSAVSCHLSLLRLQTSLHSSFLPSYHHSLPPSASLPLSILLSLHFHPWKSIYSSISPHDLHVHPFPLCASLSTLFDQLLLHPSILTTNFSHCHPPVISPSIHRLCVILFLIFKNSMLHVWDLLLAK